jgi:hypothetical protein
MMMNVSASAVGLRRRVRGRPDVNVWRLAGWASVVVSVVAMVMVIAIFSTTNVDAVAAAADVLQAGQAVDAFEVPKKSAEIRELPAQF